MVIDPAGDGNVANLSFTVYALFFSGIVLEIPRFAQLILAVTVAAVSGRPEPRKLKTPAEEFADFKVKFGKAYIDIKEESSRFLVFQVSFLRWVKNSIRIIGLLH